MYPHALHDGDAVLEPVQLPLLRAEMDLLVAVSNCPQTLNPATGGQPTPIRVRVSDA